MIFDYLRSRLIQHRHQRRGDTRGFVVAGWLRCGRHLNGGRLFS